MIDIQGGHLYQWDVDREVRIKPRTEINEVHFAHPNDAEALVLKANLDKYGFYSANIPNILLQSAENIVIYAVNNDVTVEKCTVNVIEREKPADYVYTETEVKRWEDLEKIVNKLNNRFPSIKTVMDEVAVVGTQYYLGEVTELNITLPEDAEIGQEITVAWYNGETASTLAIDGNMLNFDYIPEAKTRSEINALFDGTYWSVIGMSQGVQSEATV